MGGGKERNRPLQVVNKVVYLTRATQHLFALHSKTGCCLFGPPHDIVASLFGGQCQLSASLISLPIPSLEVVLSTIRPRPAFLEASKSRTTQVERILDFWLLTPPCGFGRTDAPVCVMIAARMMRSICGTEWRQCPHPCFCVSTCTRQPRLHDIGSPKQFGACRSADPVRYDMCHIVISVAVDIPLLAPRW